MKPIAVCLLTLVLSCSLLSPESAAPAAPQAGAGAEATSSATASSQPGASSAGLAAGTTIHVVLNKSVDAKKNKPGDAVVAKTTEAVKGSGQVIPKGTKVIGHLTAVQARTKAESQSKLGISFDRFVLKNGSQVPLSASIQAVAEAETAAAAPETNEEPMAPAGGMGGGNPGGRGGSTSSAPGRAASPVGTLAQTTTTATNSAGQAVGQAAGVSSAGQLSAASRGVIGLNGLSLDTQASASEGSVIRSEHQNVRLEGGTRILLRVNAQ